MVEAPDFTWDRTAPEPEASRLVRTGATTWVEAEWARKLCVMCTNHVAPGDLIACRGCRPKIDAELAKFRSGASQEAML